ncbi:hypothetical protein MWN33_18645 [Starkeya koreensis]|uniref:PsiF repeat-containing protein n=1 Tax=Ancylobacter koreensis TaxID=266121 RepID=A0ABT0DS07_9HYPH|nr:hypothetical protein [Ancylobacter koreensis]MCK0210056.1 hypothetical protein [Ancylobacter koreensis]
MKTLPALVLLACALGAGPALAQSASAPSPAKICADRWNEMKAKNQTGDQTYRDFAKECLAQAEAKKEPADARPAETPARRGTPATGSAAVAAQPSIKQCADLWNEMKTKNQTGNQTYRDFAKQCLAGTGAEPEPETPAKDAAKETPKEAAPKEAAPKPRTSVPSVAARPTPEPGPSLAKQPDENDREAVNRCNAEWGDYKTRHNLSGAKAWHVFMARCLP